MLAKILLVWEYSVTLMQKVKCLNSKYGQCILDIPMMMLGKSVREFSIIHLKTVKIKRYIYFGRGVLHFTINVDCSMPFLPLKKLLYYFLPDKSSQNGCAMLGVFYCSEKGQAILRKIHVRSSHGGRRQTAGEVGTKCHPQRKG